MHALFVKMQQKACVQTSWLEWGGDKGEGETKTVVGWKGTGCISALKYSLILNTFWKNKTSSTFSFLDTFLFGA